MSAHKKLNKMLNQGSTSIEDLSHIAKSVRLKPKFIGSMYDLPKSLPVGKYIVLIHPDPSVSAGHWVAIDVKKNRADYYDSFGQPPPKRIESSINKPLWYNEKQIQSMNAEHCGLFAIYFLIYGQKALGSFRIINTFD